MPKVPPWVVQVMAQQNFCQAGDLCGERRGICYLDITVQNPIQRLIYGSTQSGNKCTDPTPLRGKNSSLVGCALEIVDKCRNAWKGENVLSLWDPAAAVESGSQDELHRSANSDPEFRSESHWRGRRRSTARTWGTWMYPDYDLPELCRRKRGSSSTLPLPVEPARKKNLHGLLCKIRNRHDWKHAQTLFPLDAHAGRRVNRAHLRGADS